MANVQNNQEIIHSRIVVTINRIYIFSLILNLPLKSLNRIP